MGTSPRFPHHRIASCDAVKGLHPVIASCDAVKGVAACDCDYPGRHRQWELNARSVCCHVLLMSTATV